VSAGYCWVTSAITSKKRATPEELRRLRHLMRHLRCEHVGSSTYVAIAFSLRDFEAILHTHCSVMTLEMWCRETGCEFESRALRFDKLLLFDNLLRSIGWRIIARFASHGGCAT
jgi:hypothetical protein